MIARARTLLLSASLVAGAGVAVQAMAPPLPCEGLEGGMVTHRLTVLDPERGTSGVTLERYQVDVQPDASPEGVYRNMPAPVRALDDFFGVRVTHCASGAFHAIATSQAPETVAAALAATEHLRPAVQAGRQIGRSQLSDAVRAVYGRTIELRETEETCGCGYNFPELRPSGMTPYANRTDTGN